MNIADIRSAFENSLARGGVRAALGFLNSLSGHRFTGMYQFDDPTMRNLYFYDRESPETEAADDFPVEVTYCVFVRESGSPFILEDALRDERTTGHPSRQVVQSYCGVPLIDEAGRTVGTLCHFDCVPVPRAYGRAEMMEAVASLLARSIHSTPPKIAPVNALASKV